MKKYIKTFGEIPEEVMVLSTKVFFDHDGIALVEDDVAEVLEQIPGYSFVADVTKPTKEVKAPVVHAEATEEVAVNEPTEEDDEDTSEEEEEEEVEPKPVMAPSRPRRPSPIKK